MKERRVNAFFLSSLQESPQYTILQAPQTPRVYQRWVYPTRMRPLTPALKSKKAAQGIDPWVKRVHRGQYL